MRNLPTPRNVLAHAIALALRHPRAGDSTGPDAAAAIMRWVYLGMMLVLLGACTPRLITRTETVEVPRYVRTPVPAELTTPRTTAAPPPACRDGGARVLCNGQLAQWTLDLRERLDQCNADKASIAALGEKSP